MIQIEKSYAQIVKYNVQSVTQRDCLLICFPEG